MKVDFNEAKRTMMLTPEPAEMPRIMEFFPDEYLKTSKVIKVKPFVDQYGEPTERKYIEIKGQRPKTETDLSHVVKEP